MEAAVAATFGWNGDGPRARIAPNRTIDGFTAACERILEVARGAAASRSPPLGPHRCSRSTAHWRRPPPTPAARCSPPTNRAYIGPQGLRIWWIDRVAVLTDQAGLLADDSVEAADEFLFTLPRPDLVVADRTFAGVAAGAGSRSLRSPTSTRSPSPSPRGRDADCVSSRSTSTAPLARYTPLLERIDQIARATTSEAPPNGYRAPHENSKIASGDVADPQPRVGS